MLPGIEPGFEEYYVIKILSDNHYTIAPYVITFITRVIGIVFLELDFNRAKLTHHNYAVQWSYQTSPDRTSLSYLRMHTS